MSTSGLPGVGVQFVGGTEAVTARGQQRDDVRRRRPRGRSSRVPIRTMWYDRSTVRLGVQRILGLGGYQTATFQLRRAMVVNGEVEVDETYVGGREVGVKYCRRNPGSGHRSYPHGACRGRIRREPHSFRPNGCVPGSNDSNRWLASIFLSCPKFYAITRRPLASLPRYPILIILATATVGVRFPSPRYNSPSCRSSLSTAERLGNPSGP